ncbi:geranylgeranyl reductase family protein [Pseudooceanicola aestuarii]|uniref:geranylgeranyl reductase family protein n=1 Tax=Pseudooceanicola aestuarii TaxID=2697319 RepID=UPI0013D7C39E|nr:geranylgeranyl reductase family protein [Pseudooceanicola aestuarii]
MKDAFDVIVLGAGPAGAAAAITVARAGLRVALVDRYRFPREKLCGGGFTGRSLRYYRRIFGAAPPRAILETKTDVRFAAHGQDLGLIRDIPPMHLTMRRELDRHMVALALEAGATDLTGQPIAAIDTEAPALTLKSGRSLTAALLIGADGANSQVARALFGESFNRARIGFGLEVEAPPKGDNTAAPLRIDFGAAEWGYGWHFPKRGSSTIGVGGVLARNADMKSAMGDYLALLGHDPAMASKGQFLPFGDFRRVPGRGKVLLAGDAAGLVDPITGEGIAFAMRSGQLAARSAVAAIAARAPDSALPRYRAELRPIHRSLRQARAIRVLIFSRPLRGAFVRAFRGSGTLRHLYFRLLAGEIEYPEMTRATLRRLPVFAWKALRGGQRRADG